MTGPWEFWVDRGGTFTDVVARAEALGAATAHPAQVERDLAVGLPASQGPGPRSWQEALADSPG